MFCLDETFGLTPDELYDNMFTRYNRFKLAQADDYLSRGFAHVFFTKPDCNIYGESGHTLNDKTKADHFRNGWPEMIGSREGIL